MAGNTLGPRSYYLYTDDAAAKYSILMDVDNASAVGNVLDDTNPPPPSRFRPRVVHVEGTVDDNKVRKSIPVGSPTAAIYKTNSTAAVTIDGVQFQTTGRRGERLSFATNGISGPPAP